VSLLADYFVLASGDSERQLKAITDEIELKLKHEFRAIPLHMDGEPGSGWVVIDYGGVIIHLFRPEVRAYYHLEELWNNARVVVKIQ